MEVIQTPADHGARQQTQSHAHGDHNHSDPHSEENQHIHLNVVPGSCDGIPVEISIHSVANESDGENATR